MTTPAGGGGDDKKTGKVIGILALILIVIVVISNSNFHMDIAGTRVVSFGGNTAAGNGSNRGAGTPRGQHVAGPLKPTIDCGKAGGRRTINPNTGKPSCYVPD